MGSTSITVILNKEVSNKFQEGRGIRQGDPLSCLLFNISIEPMSHALQTTEDLSGLEIPTKNTHKKVILALFTDDAMVFLSKKDNPDSLFKILDKWCAASGAKFNKDKTVVIPVGSENHRREVRETHTLNNTSNFTFPDQTHILIDGETTRYLGAQVGNTLNRIEPWPKIIEEIESSL